MQEKGMQKVWKMIPKCIQNGSQNPSKFCKIPEKNGIRILMPKFDAKIKSKLLRAAEFADFECVFWPCPGAGGR